MKFYHTPEFKNLEAEWRQKLEESQFKDHEDFKGALKQHDTRTNLCRSQDEVAAFYTDLSALVNNYPEMPRKERQIIDLYLEGMQVEDILKHVSSKRRCVFYVIKKYRDLVHVYRRMMEAS